MMERDTSYPEPEQLRKYAEEPMPFHEFTATDLELVENDKIRVGIENVEYIYHPTYFLIDPGHEDWDRQKYPEWVDKVDGVWKDSLDWEIQKDFICTTGFSDGQKYEAYWVLETIEIENPNLYN